MNINQKMIRLLQGIINARKGYCGSHFVYTPQLKAEDIDELYAELLSESASQPGVEADVENRCPECNTTLDDGKCWDCVGDGGSRIA